MLAPSGRTGPDIVTWCPGQTATVTMGGNPACGTVTRSDASLTLPNCVLGSCPGTGTQMLQPRARVRYQRTAAQLGGPARADLGGTFNAAAVVFPFITPSNPVCFLADGMLHPTGAIGAAFGVYIQNAAPPGPCYTNVGGVTYGGAITGTPTGSTPFMQPNYTLASFGVPFTAGMLRITTSTAGGGTAMFTLTGSDNRTPSGAGNITLVGGAVSQRIRTGRSANRSFLQLKLPEPTALAGAAGALLALLACHRLARRHGH